MVTGRNLFRLASALMLASAAFAQARPEQHRAPYLNLSAGRTVATRYNGDRGLTRARALSTGKGDFDEDGMPDLVSGFAVAGGAGAIAIHRGNVDALWPYGALRGTDPPAFLPDARTVSVPEQPDFLAAGDFDADGHWDIVAAQSGSAALYFLKGDGHGQFAEAKRVPLPGRVTAMTSGEINRPDGLTDLMVAVTGDAGPQVLIFESPGGALAGPPEVFPLSGYATALAVIPLDGGLMNGLAVATGRDLMLIHGRDRRLTRNQTIRDSVPAATINRQTFGFAIQALAVGHFTSDTVDLAALGDDGQLHILERSDARQRIARLKRRDGTPVAGPQPTTSVMNHRASIGLPLTVKTSGVKLTTARVAATGRDSLIVVDAAARKLHVVSHTRRDDPASLSVSVSLDVGGAPAAVEAMRINKDALHDLVVLAEHQTEPLVYTTGVDHVFMVTNTSDDLNTAGSLRQAIYNGNLYTNVEIDFNIPLTDPNRDPTTGVFTIQPIFQSTLEALPNVGTMTIDAYTQPGSSPNTLATGDNAHPLIEINGSMAGLGPSGLQLFGADTVIRGVIVTNFLGKPDSNDPRYVDGGGGFDLEADNCVIEGNFVGINGAGTSAKPNSVGFFTMSNDFIEAGSVIGGTTPQARNVISGNLYTGIFVSQMSVPNTFFLQGNYIGTDRTGTQIVPNQYSGVVVLGYNDTVGGTAAGAGNVVSGNGLFNVAGEIASSYPEYNLIQGNLIGTDPTGTVRIQPFGSAVTGIVLAGSNADTVGGTTPAARNVVSGNRQAGIWMVATNENDLIEGNYVGLDITGAQALPNTGAGISLGTDYTDIFYKFHTGVPVYASTIGGEIPGAGNVISGNGGPGISITSHSGLTNINTGEILNNVIAGNLIGTDSAGVNAVGNQGDGIVFQTFAAGNTVGGTDPGAANTIAYNTGNGITIDPGATATVSNNVVTGNNIYSNGGAGVRIVSGTGNRVRANRIYSNGALGIDLDAAGVLANSACQANTSGANLLQNAPVLTAGSGSTFVSATATDALGNTSEFSNCVTASLTGNILNIAGTLNSKPSTTYTIDYYSNSSCDASGYGQGKVYLGSATITTAAGTCNGSIGGSLNLASADLSVTNVLGATSYPVNMPVPAFTSVVTNAGPAAATSVVWTDVLPANMGYLSATVTQGSCSVASQTITCNLGNLPVGGTVTLAISVVVSAAGSYPNTVSISSATPDANAANNTATATLTSSYAPVLDHLTPASVNVGSPALTLTVVGQGFMPSSVVSYNGVVYASNFSPTWNPADCGKDMFGRATTYCTALSITVPASLLTSVTSVPVTVSGASGSLTFSVVTPPVVPGPVTHFVLSGYGSSVAAGSMQMLYITAKDAAGLTVTTYLGTVNLTTTDPADGVFTNGGGSATVTFTASVAGMAATIVNLQTVGMQSVTATDAANAAISGTLATNVSNGAAGILSLTGSPQAALPGHAFALPLSVRVTDMYGNVVPNQKVTFSAPTSGASAILSSSVVYTNSSGVASVTATANSTSGVYAVGVTYGAGFAGGGPNADVFLLTNGTGVATLTATAGTPQWTYLGQAFPTKLQARLADGLGNPIAGATVWFSTVSIGGYNGYTPVAIPSSAVTNSSGVVSIAANGATNGPPGLYPTNASVGGMTATFDLTLKTPEPVVMTTPAGTPQTTAVGYPFAVPLTVKVTDGWGTVRSGVVVTFIPPASGASATLASGTVSTDTSGIATVIATANGVQGAYTVAASVGGVTVNFTLTNGPAATGPPATITAIAGTPQSRTVQNAFSTAFQALVKNANGDPLPGVSVTFSAPTTGASGTFAGSATVTTNGIGIATAPVFTANTVAGAYTVIATAGTVSTTFALTNTGGAPSAISIYAGDNQSATINTAYGTPLAVLLTDSFGNRAGAGYSVFFYPAAGDSGAVGSYTGTTTFYTGSDGIATASTLQANGKAGTFNVLAMYGSVYQIFTLTNTTAAPAAIVAVAGTPQSAAVGQSFNLALSAKVTDAGGNPLPGFTVTFTAPATGASALLTSPSAITNAAGIASVAATANSVGGTYNVNAVSGAYTAAFNLTNIAGNRCDINRDTVVNQYDVPAMVVEALGTSVIDDLDSDGKSTVVDVQVVINAAMGHGCLTR